MFSSDRSIATEPIIDIDSLKTYFPQYYSCLREDELKPYKIILCTNLLLHREESLEKLILIYSSKLLIIKNINNSISKLKLAFEEINFVVNEGLPNSNCITIDYKSELMERFFYDSNVNDLVNGLLVELRKKLIESSFCTEEENNSDFAFSDAEENKYLGAAIARAAILEKATIICSIKQKKVYNYPGLVFSKIVTPTHFTMMTKNEIVIFIERITSRASHNISGDLIHVPLRALKNVTLEATGKGMIMKYIFNSERKLELFYENERTDQLLKIMSYINSLISR